MKPSVFTQNHSGVTTYAAWSLVACVAATAIASLPRFYEPVNGRVAAAYFGSYEGRGTGDYITVVYTYEWEGVVHKGVGSLLAAKNFPAPYGPAAKAAEMAWMNRHPVGSPIEVLVFRPMPSISGYQRASGDWFSRHILVVLGAWLVHCVAIAIGVSLWRKVMR